MVFMDERLPLTPSYLTKPTRARVLRSFMVRTKAVMPGEVVTLTFAEARDMIALKKAELVEPSEAER